MLKSGYKSDSNQGSETEMKMTWGIGDSEVSVETRDDNGGFETLGKGSGRAASFGWVMASFSSRT